MRCNRVIPPVLILLLCALVPLAQAQEDSEEEQEAASDEASEPEFHMSIVHAGPGQAADGLKAIFPDQAREIDAGDDSFTGLFLPQETPGQQGGAVIIPDTGRSPAHGLAAGLRRALPESGWSTLAISLPESMVDPLPERVFKTRSEAAEASGDGANGDDGDEAQDDGDQEQDPDRAQDDGDERSMTIEVTQGGSEEATGDRRESWQEAGMARVGAAVQVLRNQGVENIVLIGIGDGADLALRYTQANAAMFPPGGIGLVWLDARFRPPFDQSLDEVLGEGYAIPVLDLYDRDRTGRLAPQRQKAARRGGFEGYSQSALPMPHQSRRAAEKRAGSWVGGWLNQNMVGTELK